RSGRLAHQQRGSLPPLRKKRPEGHHARQGTEYGPEHRLVQRPRGEFPGGARRLSPEGRGLVVQGLTKTYGKLVAVDQLFFEVKPGDILALLGPHDTGETKSILRLARLLRPDHS